MNSNANTANSHSGDNWRTWPLYLLWLLVPLCLVPEQFYPGNEYAMTVRFAGPGLIGILVMVWWAFFSRAGLLDRIITTVSVLVIAGFTIAFLDPSMKGPAMVVVTIPIGIGLFSISNLLFSGRPFLTRYLIVVALTMAGFFSSLLLRNEGLWGETGLFALRWRFNSQVEKTLASKNSELKNQLATYSEKEISDWLSQPQWPEFLGPKRDGIIRNLAIDSDWQTHPPKQLWAVPTGLGWSSVSVAGNLLFTQEQRDRFECVVCYDAQTGKEIWIHSIESRFEEHLGGTGPRATPTIAEGDIFNLGANGQLSRIDGRTGENKWTIDLKQPEYANRQPTTWGFCSSPLVISGKVIVHGGGKEDRGIIAINTTDGKIAWKAPSGDHSYSSPHSVQLSGNHYIAMATNKGIDLHDPETGSPILEYDWEKKNGYRTPQPVSFGSDSIILAGENGTRILKLQKDEETGKLSVTKETEAKKFRPDFNDFVVFGDFAYGFSGANFRSVNLKTGETSKNGKRYGKGQVLLIEDSELLIVVTESGELALLEIDGMDFEQIAKLEGLSDRTWNHPVIVGDRLYIRNSKQMKCYQLHRR